MTGNVHRVIVISVLMSNKNILIGRVRFYYDRIESKVLLKKKKKKRRIESKVKTHCQPDFLPWLITDGCIISGGINYHLSFTQHRHTIFSLWCEYTTFIWHNILGKTIFKFINKSSFLGSPYRQHLNLDAHIFIYF